MAFDRYRLPTSCFTRLMVILLIILARRGANLGLQILDGGEITCITLVHASMFLIDEYRVIEVVINE